VRPANIELRRGDVTKGSQEIWLLQTAMRICWSAALERERPLQARDCPTPRADRQSVARHDPGGRGVAACQRRGDGALDERDERAGSPARMRARAGARGSALVRERPAAGAAGRYRMAA
jgi:hypothetical protein